MQASPAESSTEPSPEPSTDPRDLDNPSLYINREISLLGFNQRVLAQA